MSPDRPEMPSSPASWSSASLDVLAVEAARPLHPEQEARVDAPDRVAMTRPSSGVKPIVVSTERPAWTAASDAPAPR